MKIHLFEGFAILFANKLNTEWHSHQALQITLSSDRKELKCETELGTIVGEGILIPPLVSHKFSLGTQDIALVLIDEMIYQVPLRHGMERAILIFKKNLLLTTWASIILQMSFTKKMGPICQELKKSCLKIGSVTK